jgi:hypothetical protein
MKDELPVGDETLQRTSRPGLGVATALLSSP